MATHEDTFNITVADFHTFLVGTVGLLVHNIAPFTSTQRVPAQIYGIKDNVTGEIVYVGKTTQGINVRFSQQIAGAHPEWASGMGPCVSPREAGPPTRPRSGSSITLIYMAAQRSCRTSTLRFPKALIIG